MDGFKKSTSRPPPSGRRFLQQNRHKADSPQLSRDGCVVTARLKDWGQQQFAKPWSL
jgi:hypothetical protein